jgi:ligand-binding sensor domain-containing protein
MSDLHVVAVAFAGGDALTPATAFAATASGRLFRNGNRRQSTGALDAGDVETLKGQGQWQEVNTWAGLGVAVVLAPSPAFATDQTLFAGTPAGMYRTQDDGQSWESCNFGLFDEDVLCLVCAPNFAQSEIVWAGTAGGGLYRSRNSGRAWRESGIGLPDAAVQSLAFSPNFGEDHTLFAGMEAHGLYVSRDGGESWNPLALPHLSVNTLACPQTGLIWAGTEDGLWRVAADNSEAVQVAGAGEVVMSVSATAADQVAVGLFGSGLWVTDDSRGEAQSIVWQKPTLALHAPPVVANVGDQLFALDADGSMARSVDGGAQWTEMEIASAEDVFALAGARHGLEPDAANPAGMVALFGATSRGLSRWNEETGTWQEVVSEPALDAPVLDVDLSPAFGYDHTLLAVANEGELRVSHEQGATWQEITGPWLGQSLLRAQFAPDDPDEIMALTVAPTEAGHFDVTVWHTIDLGQNWETLAGFSSGVPAVMVAWPQDGAEHALFLATQHRVIKLYRQIDPPAFQVHQHFFDETLRVTALSVSPDYAYSNIIWAATTGGLYRSVDRGLSWGLLLDLPLDLPVIWLNVTFTHIDAVTLGGRVWRAAL